MFRKNKASKRGFTLLETMLSVALLLIVSLVVYEGFLTVLSYAADTALADRMSNTNQQTMYESVSDVTNGAKVAAVDSGAAIYIDGGGINNVYMVKALTGDAGASHLTGTSLMQDPQFTATTKRHGFYYVCRGCPTHNEPLSYYEVDDGHGGKNIVGKCPHKDAGVQCGYSIVIR